MKKKMIIWSLILFLCSCSITSNDKVIEKVLVPKEKKVNSWTGTKVNFSKYDLYKDSSITKYVDNKVHYNNLEYIPENLVDLKWKYLIDIKNNQKVRKIMLDNLEKLSKDFYNTFNKKLKIVSAYRGYKYQKWIKDRGCSDIFCANAGYSEHQSGLAVDFWEATEEKRFKENEELKTYFNWMKGNWAKYGFTNTYQKWIKIDWYSVEPWHWRYVWVELATYLKKEDITFAEFYYKNNNPPLTPPL